ncbi:MAG: ankyrin repeat domain-containing protein [Bacteroidota bacterium]
MKRSLALFVLSLLGTCLFAQSMYRTACQGNLSRLDSMLQHASINDKDQRDRSLIHWAVACEQEEIFHYLVKKGIDINAIDDQGKTPMHMAVRFEDEKYLDLLYQLQPNKNWLSTFGPSLLQDAVLKRNKDFIEKLIGYGININDTNARGSTALEIAQKIHATEISNVLLSLGADPELVRTQEIRGPYMGQARPGLTAKVFAPNFISTEEYEFGSVFNKKGDEFYYGVDVGGNSEIRFTQLVNGSWTRPKVLLADKVYGYNDPFLSPDEQRLYFISRRAMDGKGPLKKDYDIWFVERKGSSWSEPINAGPNINSEGNEYYISFTQDGTMYYSSNGKPRPDKNRSDMDIYSSKFVDGKFQKAVSAGDAINTVNYEADVFIDPAERYIIFCATRPDGMGRGDLYISFKQDDGSWTPSKNMGSKINTRHHELCPFVSADGNYFFYTSDEDIYWISTKVFEEMK